MDVELLTLAGAAAEALVQAMVSDGWRGMRAKIARIMGGGDPERVPAEEAELERSGQALRDSRIPASVMAGHWQGRFVELLTGRPECAGEIADLLRELQSSATGTTNVQIRGHNNGNLFIADHITARIHGSDGR
jgi:hypothetical protein